MNIGYGRKVLTDNASVSVSTSKSNMNSNGTTYQNGLFVNVDEEHNNTKNMTLSGFNQIGGKVTGNIQNLTIESKQNTSSTTGSTKGGSLSLSPNSNVISGVGINYANKDLESITKNTVIGNVEIGKASGAEINKDLASMTEVTKDRKFETNVNIESQTIKYALNPEAFKQDLEKAKNEITDIGNVVENTVNPKGKDKRNIFANLRAQRWNTSFYNVTGSRMEELSRQFKAGEIDEKELKEAARDLIKGYGKDIGIDFEVLYLDEATMPKDSKGSTGSSYILDKKNRKVLIPIDVNKLKIQEIYLEH